MSQKMERSFGKMKARLKKQWKFLLWKIYYELWSNK